jgi:putative PIN family toxin of toxin-antitoxin system
MLFDFSKINGTILVSEDTFDELNKILLKTKFDKYISNELRQSFLIEFKKICLEVKISENFSLCRDEKDNKFLNLAASGFADYLITGDSDLLVLNPFRQTQIVTPITFLDKYNG